MLIGKIWYSICFPLLKSGYKLRKLNPIFKTQEEVETMKAVLTGLIPIMLLASSCGTGVYLTSGYTDDVYYSPADRPVVIEKRTQAAVTVPARSLEQEQAIPDTVRVAEPRYALVDSTYQEYVDENGNTVVNNNYYYEPEDDYYYSNRINRFYRPSMGFGFYDSWWGMNDWGYYDPWYSSFYSPWGYSSWYSPWGYNSWYSPWGYNSWYSPWYSSWWGWDGWDGNNNNKDNYYYGHRRSGITDGISSNRSGEMYKSNPVYATRGTASGAGSELKSNSSAAPAVRSASDPKSESRPSGYRSGVSTGQDPQNRPSAVTSPSSRTNSGSYVRSRTGSSYVNPQSNGISQSRSSSLSSDANRSTYIRPKTSGSAGSSGTYDRSTSVSGSRSGTVQSSGSSRSGSYQSSSPVRSSGSAYQGSSPVRSSSGTSYRSSNPGSSSYNSGSSSYKSSGSSGYSSSGSSFRSSSSGSSGSGGSFSSGSSGRSSSSGSSSSGSSSSRSGGGGSSGRR